MTAIAHRVAVVAIACVLLTACSSASEPALETGVVENDSQSGTSSLQGSSSTTDRGPSDDVASFSPTGPVDATQLTQTEYLVVGTWEIISIGDLERIRFGAETGDTCTFESDFSMECTISGEASTGRWMATDAIVVGDLSTSSTLHWLFRGETNSSSGSAPIVVDETEMVIRSGDSTWALIERLPRRQPEGGWIDTATQELMGSWTLMVADEERTISKFASAGDVCTFNPDHTFVCDGEGARTAIWQTARSLFEGTTLVITGSGNARISGVFEISGDVLTWDVVDAVWTRTE